MQTGTADEEGTLELMGTKVGSGLKEKAGRETKRARAKKFACGIAEPALHSFRPPKEAGRNVDSSPLDGFVSPSQTPLLLLRTLESRRKE